MMIEPSILAHILNGLTLLIAIVLFALNYPKMDATKIVCAMLLLSIAFGIHGLSHLGLETVYGYNPWKFIS